MKSRALTQQPSTPPPAPVARHSALLREAVCESVVTARASTAVVGILDGEGIGPELLTGTIEVMQAAAEATGLALDIRRGGEIGVEAQERHGEYLTPEVTAFFEATFAAGGAILCGPGGGRFVYDLRRRFDLFCKLAPIRIIRELASASTLFRGATLPHADIMVVRDNIGGVYQGEWSESFDPTSGRTAKHSFGYTEAQVRRLMKAAVRVAKTRGSHLSVVLKDGGVPTVTRLWKDVAAEVCQDGGVTVSTVNVDYAVYRMLECPQAFDTMVAPNLFGDIMADLGGYLIGSRGLCYSTNYCPNGCGVYQTGHGSAHDLAGTDTANPIAQIQSMAMMLRESFGRDDAAAIVELAVINTFKDGWRTTDLPLGGTVVGTRRLCELIAAKVRQLAAESTPMVSSR